MAYVRFVSLTALCVALAGPVLAQPAPAAAPAVEMTPALQAASEMLKLYSPTAKPSLNKNFAYLNVVTTSPRTQQVYLSAEVLGPDYAKVRELTSNVMKFTGPIDAAIALRLLTENENDLPKGAYVVQTNSDGTHMISFESYLPVDAAATAVQQAVNYNATTADKLEAELTGKDDY